MKRFAQACESIAATASKLEKTRLLAEYLRTLETADLEAAARFFTGNPFAARDDRTLAVGSRTIIAAARAVWGFDDTALSASYRESGDLGATLAPFLRPPNDLGLFRATLSPSSLKSLLDEMAAAVGRAANRRRAVLCERAFAACEDVLEAKYVVKLLTGELRIGLREELVLDGIAQAFAAPIDDVRRATMAAGDVGVVALAARERSLAEVEIAYGSPIAFMLASPLQFGSDYREIASGTWLIEDKYDGVRIQAHKDGAQVRLFSRTLNDVSSAWPEIVAALAGIEGNAIFDGEIIAEREGRVQPFRTLQPRLQRKVVEAALIAEIPATFVIFDLLARNAEFLLDLPLVDRRERLAEFLLAGPIRVAPWSVLETASSPEVVHERFEAARERGNEGLMLKRTDAPYAPGKRGKWWLKLKRELATFDVAVIAVEWGHGRRVKVLSDYTFAVRGDDGDFVTLGKAYSGLTDVEIAEMTQWFLAHRLPDDIASQRYDELELKRREMLVEPTIVIEIAFDIIQQSTLHRSGFALRFPRIVRLRPDKSVHEIDALATVRNVYAAMIEREG